jgi:hypothetical protein
MPSSEDFVVEVVVVDAELVVWVINIVNVKV